MLPMQQLMAMFTAVSMPQLSFSGVRSVTRLPPRRWWQWAVAIRRNRAWPAVPGTDAIILYRKNVLTDAVEELARVPGTSYRDSAVSYGDSFAYSLATVVGETVSPAGAGEWRAFCRHPCTNAKPPGSLKDDG